MLLSGRSPEAASAPAQTLKIGWNVDREAFLSDEGLSQRTPSGDCYRLRFAIESEQVDMLRELV